MMKLLDTYKSILRYSGCQEVNGRIHAKVNDMEESSPLELQGRPWVLPTDDNLKKAFADNLAVFHPLSENLLKGESNDVKKLKACISIRLNYTLYELFLNLLKLGADAALHKQFNPKQNELCVALKNVKEEQVRRFSELGLDALLKRDLYGFVFINLKRAGTIGNVKYSRTGNISFPFYEKLKACEEINDKKMKNSDRELYIRLCEYVFPEIKEVQKYSFGSNANTAPFLEALMRSSYNIVERIMDIYDTFEEFIPNPAIYEFDVNWLEPFQDLPGYEKEIRTVLVSQSSNEIVPNVPVNTNTVPITNTGNGVSPANMFQSLNQRQMQGTGGNMFFQQPALTFPPQPMHYQQQYQQAQAPSWAVGRPIFNQNNIPYQQNQGVFYQGQVYPTPYQQPIQQPVYPQQYQQAFSNPYGQQYPMPTQQTQTSNLSNITVAR